MSQFGEEKGGGPISIWWVEARVATQDSSPPPRKNPSGYNVNSTEVGSFCLRVLNNSDIKLGRTLWVSIRQKKA